VNEDIKILEAVERYILGQMSPDERVYFEQLRKSNPEIDQAVVEHTFFLQQMNRFDDVKKLKSNLSEAHIHLAEKGMIKSPRLKGKARVVYLYNRYKRVSAIAASIAGLTALTISALVWAVSPAASGKRDFEDLSRHLDKIGKEVTQIKSENVVFKKQLSAVTDSTQVAPVINYTSGGTGFLVDTKGYVVTNAHVVKDARHIAVQAANGQDLQATVVYNDNVRDIAILKITDNAYKAPSGIPYGIKRSGGELAESIYTLGFPRNDIVYGNGYIAARTGSEGDTLTCQVDISANRGNSGSPILNRNGEVIGMISNKKTSAVGAVFAIHSKYIYQAISELQKDSSFRNVKLTTASSVQANERTQQVKKISDYIYLVKVD
jgi:S1-C subfamily serine protease